MKVNTVLDDFLTAPLSVPVPKYDILELEDAIGTFAQWPTKLARFSAEVIIAIGITLFILFHGSYLISSLLFIMRLYRVMR